eukprot:TRINITY_DN25669_c0_g1_i1.p1 TRINITY_DN25669_c0_g1~~TRINITY_DN25669_c0_g1_i1.p1  ORF type:complete len:102 (-),score=2.67 TRINITY_DN25669_c0_g1_i1:16-291(-)
MGATPTFEPADPSLFEGCPALWEKIQAMGWGPLLHKLRGDMGADIVPFYKRWKGGRTTFRKIPIEISEESFSRLLEISAEGERIPFESRGQ